MMLQGILFDEFDEKLWPLLNVIGATGSLIAYDRWIDGQDFSAGQSILMVLGSASGIAFGFGAAILLDVQDAESMLSMALAGYGFGTYFTRKIVKPHRDGSIVTNKGTSFSLVPTILPLYKGNSMTLITGIAFHAEF